MTRTVLLVIDAQELLMNNNLYEFDLFSANVKKLISEARNSGVEIIYIRHDDGKGKPLSKANDGYDIYYDFAHEKGKLVFDKTVNSPFKESGLLEHLREICAGKLIVTGLQTDYCIDATVKCGFEYGFEIIVPKYCNTTYDNEYMTAEATYSYYNDFIWNDRYAKSVSLAEAIDLIRSR